MQQGNSIPHWWRDFRVSLEPWQQPPEWQCEIANSLKGQGWAKDLFFTHSDHETHFSTYAFLATNEEDMKDVADLVAQAKALVRKIFGLLNKRMDLGDYEIRVLFFNRHLFNVGAMKVIMAKVVAGKLGQLTPIYRDLPTEKVPFDFTLNLLTLHAFLLQKGFFFFHFYDPITDKQEAGSTTLGIVKIIGPDDTVTPPPDRIRMVKDLRKYLPEEGWCQDICFRFISQHDGLCMKTVKYPLWRDATDIGS